jgi:hypothetical protein
MPSVRMELAGTVRMSCFAARCPEAGLKELKNIPERDRILGRKTRGRWLHSGRTVREFSGEDPNAMRTC